MTSPISFFSLKNSIILLGILLLSFFSYHDSLTHGFLHWDSQLYVIDNPYIKDLTWENLKVIFTGFYADYWCPLTWMSLALDYAVYGLEPAGYHLTNLIFHGLNTLLFFLLTITLIRLSATEINNTSLVAGIAALLFAIHPQNVESVAWVAERKNVLTLFFILLTLLSYINYTLSKSTKQQFLYYISTLLCFTLALMAKPIAVTIPVILLLIDLYPLQRTGLTHSRHPVNYQKLLLEKLPFFLLSILVALITIAAHASGQLIADLEQASVAARIFNATHSIFLYVSKYLFPITLLPLYPFETSPDFYQRPELIIPLVAVFLTTLLVGYLWYKKQYVWLISWLFYLITLLPVLGIIQAGNQAAADRFAYLSMLPFHLLVGVAVAVGWENLQKRNKKIFQIILIIAVFSVTSILIATTRKQVSVWKDDFTFWTHAVMFSNDNPVAQMNLGLAYVAKQDYENAAQYFELAAINGLPALGHYNQAMAYLKLGKWSQALELYQYLLTRNDVKNKDTLYYNMGMIYINQKNCPSARPLLEQALMINPAHRQAKELLQQCLTP